MAAQGQAWRLGRRPELDGIRGLAIALVVASHTFPLAYSPLGTLGVEMFFALSGFLITSILLEEVSASGRVSFLAFYRRRALRLVPALVVFVATMVLVQAAAGVGVEGAMAGVLALFYVSNWAMVGGWDLGVLGHTWSLSVEEHFYVLWPVVVLVLATRRRLMLSICLVGALAVVALRLGLVASESWLHLERGSDARAGSLLLGCALACALSGRRAGRSSAPLTVLGLAMVLATALLAGRAWWLLAPFAAGASTVIMIGAAVAGSGVRWLRWPPLGLLGRRSYGLYLWHYPVLTLGVVHGSGPVVWMVSALLAVACSWGLACLSWRYVEAPVSRLRRGVTTRSPDGGSHPDGTMPAGLGAVQLRPE